MTSPSWERLEVLLEQANSLPPSERNAFIARETSEDPALGAELAVLLQASDGANEYVDLLRQDLLGSGLDGVVREAAAADADDPWVGKSVFHYLIIERMGGGGMGVIYRARDTRLDRTVALKFIAPAIHTDAAARQRFLEEARAASALDHPNICTVHDIGETEDGRQFIVMAAYEGETLRSRLDRPPILASEALDIARQVARALAAAHERGIVHRDVKPDNVFITTDGVVKLLDFGLARMADHRMSGPSARVGSVAYMSPEQAAGQRTDSRSDVWALGVLLFEALAGERPFTGSSARDVLDRIGTTEPDFGALGPSQGGSVAAVVRRALARNPDQRFANGRELLDALPAAGPAEPRARGRRVRLAVALGVPTIAAVLVAMQLRLGTPPEDPPLPPGSVTDVLWVDDNPENNSGMIQRLEGMGVRVTTALSTSEGLAQFDASVHGLVISDMGRFEGAGNTYVERAGLDLLSGLLARRPGLRVVFCTSARAVNTYRTEAMARGATAVVEDCGAVLGMLGPPAP